MRALVSGLIIVAVGVGLLAFLPNIVLTRWTALTHGARVAIASAFFFIALICLAGALRYLQKREFL